MEDFLNVFLSEEDLDKRIYDAHSLKFLVTLFSLKRKRILEGKSQTLIYPVHKIFELQNEDLQLQCEALRMFFLVAKNLDEEILKVITYVNSLLVNVNNISTTYYFSKIAHLLNEVILICKTLMRESLFQDNIFIDHLDAFLLSIVQEQTSTQIRMYTLSTVLPNYINLLCELDQLRFIHKLFLQTKVVHNLDVLCIIYSYIDKKVLLTNCESLLVTDDFWQYLENCISCGTYSEQKQAIYLLKNSVQAFYDNDILKCDISCLQITKGSHQTPMKIWQHFFIILESSNEKQLHLIWPSLNLFNSLKHIDIIWQGCAYKKLLSHTQNVVVYFTAKHILQENAIFPTLNKHFLSAINKNEYTNYSIKVFAELSDFCNNLNSKDFILFLKDMFSITWIPTAIWCLFSNLFSDKLTKTVPFNIFLSTYKYLKALPHVYIRNGCMLTFLNYFINNYDWKNNVDDLLEFLFILKDFDNNLYTRTISKHVQKNCLNNILQKKNVFDKKTFEIFIEIIRILSPEIEIEAILKSIQPFDKSLLVVLYSQLYEAHNENDIENFIFEQITELNEDCTNMFLVIIKRFLKSNELTEKLYTKVLLILNDPNNYSQSVVFIALFILLNYDKVIIDVKIDITKKLKCHLFDNRKIYDDLYILFLNLYFFTEKCPEVPFLQRIIHNESDIVISKVFEYLSNINFQINFLRIVDFLESTLDILLSLKKTRHFKIIISNYINCIFSMSFLEKLCNFEMFHIITSIINSLLSFSASYPLINYYLSEKIKSVIYLFAIPDKLSYILIPIIEELLLKDAVIKKDDRVEYFICQEIYERLEILPDNPNITKIITRMASVESMIQIVNKNPEYADIFTIGLLERYRAYFNKRYFPNSLIHIQKLRIIQALLTIHPFIINKRQLVIDLIVESFCLEVHQPCVKQLMQWLLLSLLKNQDNDSFSLIKAKIDTSSKTQPSSIGAFIVVLLHLTLPREESYWFSTVEAFIPWSMGAHFKLRVYSQAAIKKLIEEAKQKNYQNFLAKYGYLEKPIISVIEASGHAFYDTLKSDELMFSTFNPENDYSLESIYVDIPKLNGVTRTEWENVLQYKFSAHNSVNIFNKNKTFNDLITKNTKNISKEIDEDIFGNCSTVQRKITPWKNAIEEQENSRQISDFVLIASLINKPTNLGGLSRTCEVFGVKHLVLNDVKIINDKEFKSLSMSSEDWVDINEVKISNLKNYILEMRKKGYSIVGAEQTSNSVCLNKYKFNKKTALLLGNEKEGIPPDLIPILDECIEIPQFGLVRSLNVHVAGATFIWEYAKQHLVQ